MKKKLTPQQRKFVREYLKDLNATQAAIRAKYSPKTARQQACVLLTKPNIQDAIAKEQERIRDDLTVTPERIIAEYCKLAFRDFGELGVWDERGRLVVTASTELPQRVLAAVKRVTRRKNKDGEFLILEFYDKKATLDSLSKVLGLFVEKKQVKVTGDLNLALKELEETPRSPIPGEE
jgi:phage terminase small subunit